MSSGDCCCCWGCGKRADGRSLAPTRYLSEIAGTAERTSKHDCTVRRSKAVACRTTHTPPNPPPEPMLSSAASARPIAELRDASESAKFRLDDGSIELVPVAPTDSCGAGGGVEPRLPISTAMRDPHGYNEPKVVIGSSRFKVKSTTDSKICSGFAVLPSSRQ